MEISKSFSFISRLFRISAFIIHFSQLSVNSAYRVGRDISEDPSYFFYQQPEYPRDCQEIINQCSASNSITSGVYLIKPDGYREPFEVFCDNSIASEGWTVIQRRIDGSVGFNREWTAYKEGFGFLSSEFWLGHEKVSFLSNQRTYELRIDMMNDAGSTFFVQYDRFRISDDWGEFKLGTLGNYRGNASVTYCPANMEYNTCSCQDTCSGGCQKNCIDGEETCICPNGFFLDQNSNCVSEQECSCYQNGFGLIPNGDSQVNSDCTMRCSCNNNQLSCVNIQCSSDAVCQEIGGVFQCQCNPGYLGDGFMCRRPTTVPLTTPAPISDCFDLYNSGVRTDGVYDINPSGVSGSEFQVYCDMTTDGGGWTVFQRRQDGSENFYRTWAEYKAGFGSLTGEHWLGNDKIRNITSAKNYQLRINMLNSASSPYYALYGRFSIGKEDSNYQISISSYSGNAGGGLPNGYPFSTYDRDNDGGTYNCAEKHQSGWWHFVYGYRSNNSCYRWYADNYYRWCTQSNLNGDYTGGNGENIFWYNLPGDSCNIPRTEMKIKPV